MAETETSTASTPPIAYEYVYFAGQPLAQIETAASRIQYYVNDHLGTPLLTTDAAGAVDWRVEREPYGARFAVRAGATIHQPLAFPGQEEGADGALSYNIFRWYRSGWGQYTQPDPLDSFGKDPIYGYARDNPFVVTDPTGLEAKVCCRKVDFGRFTFASPFRHCFVWNDGFTYELLRIGGFAHTGKAPGVPVGKCEKCEPKQPCTNPGKCLDDALNSYPQDVPYDFSILAGGPNSNTFAKELANKCCAGGFPRDMSSWWNWTPGASSPPPVPDWRDRIGDPNRW